MVARTSTLSPWLSSTRASNSERKRYDRYVKRYLKNKERHDKNVADYRKYEREYKKRKSDFGFSSSMSNFSRKFTIVLKDGKKLKARLVKISKKQDLALLNLDNYNTPFLTLSSQKYPRQGTKVFAIGSPLGITDSLTTGIITKSSKDRLFTDTYPARQQRRTADRYRRQGARRQYRGAGAATEPGWPGRGDLRIANSQGVRARTRRQAVGNNRAVFQASRTATMPVRKIPSKVPAPPIDATAVPILRISLRRSRSAPINTPIVPQM